MDSLGSSWQSKRVQVAFSHHGSGGIIHIRGRGKGRRSLPLKMKRLCVLVCLGVVCRSYLGSNLYFLG